MTGKIQFLLISTFLMGMAAGAFIYVVYFAPQFDAKTNDGSALDENAFVIEGELYGGCERVEACAQFQLRNARTYSYLSTQSAEIAEGTLPAALSLALSQTLTQDKLEDLSRKVTMRTCSSYADGIDRKYTIQRYGEMYVLDTCGTAFTGDEELKTLLGQVFMVMEDPEAELTLPVPETDLGSFILGPLFDRFHNPETQ